MVDILARGLSVLLVIALRLALILVIILLFMFILRRVSRRRIEFIKERFYEPTKKPVDSDWGIRILYPSRPIEKCIVLYNNTMLPWEIKMSLTMKSESKRTAADLFVFRKQSKRTAQRFDLKMVEKPC